MFAASGGRKIGNCNYKGKNMSGRKKILIIHRNNIIQERIARYLNPS
ncbi:hypothetical protein Cabys_2850 [Caldithrix abyssi DSM 13497]|uniref:Uncharacterized protein n=1 Tax=Caldithrix abyssi DSM 13497 TaxID=880073 RepID=A0A1J1CAP0_CALAY|nr:hypothetical protein Cabys_2850 [Caldithrix abyssi DSM 13497]